MTSVIITTGGCQTAKLIAELREAGVEVQVVEEFPPVEVVSMVIPPPPTYLEREFHPEYSNHPKNQPHPRRFRK